MTYFYEPRRDYRDSDGDIESRQPLPMHDPEYWSVYIKEEDANAFCEMKNKEK